MAERIRKLTNSEVEVLARIIADTMTGSQMNEIFQECGVQDASNESTKWKRIYYTFLARQEQDGIVVQLSRQKSKLFIMN